MKKIHILNLCYGYNFGANMVAYALQTAIAKIGFSPCHINIFPEDYVHPSHKMFAQFKEHFISLSLPIYSLKGLYATHNAFETIIVGSDQVFRFNALINMLPWASGKKRLISYAASFGVTEYTNSMPVPVRLARKLLKRFDAHSVREASAVNLMKKNFNLNAIQVLDPTLLLDPEDYQPIIDSENCKILDKYVGVMFLDEEHWDEFISSALYTKLISQGYNIVNIVKDNNGEFHSVPQWLNYIKNSSMMITDSFHGTVFSIIYRKQFIIRATKTRGNTRIESLCNTLSIPYSRFYEKFTKTDDSHFDTLLDFNPICKRIEEERVTSIDYLKTSLTIDATEKDFIPHKENKISVPILSIKENKYTKQLVVFGILPVITRSENEQLKIFGCIPFKREYISKIKCYIAKTIRFLLRK